MGNYRKRPIALGRIPDQSESNFANLAQYGSQEESQSSEEGLNTHFVIIEKIWRFIDF
jgi:hypothetical protein